MSKPKTAEPEAAPPAKWESRIVGQGEAKPGELAANPKNWRQHPAHQRGALRDALDSIGWVQQVVVNQRTGLLVDGHLRLDLAVERKEEAIPVLYVDLSPEEEALVLATLDPLSALAVGDPEQLDALVSELHGSDVGRDLAGLLSDLQAANAPDELPEIGDGDDPASTEDFWPVIRVQVPPSTYRRFRRMLDRMSGDTDAKRLANLLKHVKT